MESVKASVIIINYNTPKVTLSCVESVLKNTKKVSFEIILIDNGSKEKVKVPAVRNLKVINNKNNLGFSKANNQGIRKASGEYVLLLNSDTTVEDDVISEMAEWMDKNQEVGIASCKLVNADGTVQGTGGYFPNLLRVFSWMTIEDVPFVEKFIKPFHPLRSKSFYKNSNFYEKKQEIDWLTGAFLFIRKKVVEEIGLIDEDYFMYTEDTDFCYRAKQAGWRIVYLPRWKITHLGGASSTKEFPIVSEFKNIKLFYKKHYPAWQFPLLRFFLKVGAVLRMVFMGIIYGKEAAHTYVQAYKVA